MGTISSGIGLVSGINTAQLIDQLIAVEGRGKLTLQNRISIIQAQKTAMLDINARLLNLKNAARGFRINKVFDTALATSSNEEVLTASATTDAQPGSYKFVVKQLVSHNQVLSQGYTTADATPLGLTSLSLELGNGRLARDRDLTGLNGGAGVRRGKIVITDTTGTKTVDLSDVTTVNEALDRINGAGANVTASVSGDRFIITENSAGAVTVANASGYFTATDLGIVGTAGGGTLTGTQVNRIGATSALKSINDGNGVLIRSGLADFKIQVDPPPVGGATTYDINLGRVDAQIDGDSELADLNHGDGVAISPEGPDLKIKTRSGQTVDIKLGKIMDGEEVAEDAVSTVGELIARVNSQLQTALGSSDVQLSVSLTTNQFKLTDATVGSGTLQVIGAGPNGNETANDLGLLAIDGGSGDQDAVANQITGTLVPNTVQTAPASTLQEIIDRISTQTSGAVTATIAPDGVSLRLSTGVADTITVQAGTGDGSPYTTSIAEQTLRDLGFTDGQTAVGSVTGRRLIASLDSVLVNSLNGGDGLSGGTSLTLTDRQGDSVTVNSLNTHASLSDLVAAVNAAITASGTVNITLGLNSSENGLLVTDTSGSTAANLIVTGTAAAALGISTGGGGVAASSVRGTNLQLQYVSAGAKLADLNYGRGVGTGSFRIADGFGESAIVTVPANASTLYDVINLINSRGLALSARVNDNGDGLLIEQDLTGHPGQQPVVPIKITATGGSTAKDLNILGSSSTVEDASIDGAYERTIALDAGDTLNKLISKLNAANLPVAAALVNTGSGAVPFRLSLNSLVGGASGNIVVDTVGGDLSLSSVTEGQDAKVFFGSADLAQAFLVTSQTNTVQDLAQGLTVNLESASSEVVTVAVQRDVESIVGAGKGFVTSFNDAVARIKSYDFFDVDTKKKGPLLGHPLTGSTLATLSRAAQASATGLTTQYRFLAQIGIKAGKEGELTFDETKFRNAYENDPAAVKELLAAFDSTTASSVEVAPGVTALQTTETFSKLGMGDKFDRLLAGLTNSIDGVYTRADEGFQSQIDLTNERIERLDQKLESKRKRMQAQFAAMEQALARLQAQGSALGSLSQNLSLSSRISRLGISS